MKNILLNNGYEMPMLGLGTYKIGFSDKEVYEAVRSALDIGYRHLDTATLYKNERAIGKAIKESGIPREDIFVTTKLWGNDILANKVQEAFDSSMQLLNIDYIDLYLIHWPVKGKEGATWSEMEKLYAKGKIKSIGVSNHLQHHLQEVLTMATIKPVVNQIEMHPYLTLENLHMFCRENDIVCQAWSPLGSNKIPLHEDITLQKIAEKYKKTAAQVVLRWNIQRSVVAIPKSSQKKRQQENLDIFDFELNENEMITVSSLNRNLRTGVHPDEIGF